MPDVDGPASPHALSPPVSIPGRDGGSRASNAARALAPLSAALDAHEGVPAWTDDDGGPLTHLRIAPASRDLEPGGWVEGDVRETPPAPSAWRSSRFGDALEAEQEAGEGGTGASAAVAVADATAPECDGLVGGEAAWWAASSGSIYPAFAPDDGANAADADALWAGVRASAVEAATEPLLAAHVAATIGDADDLPDALAAVLGARLEPCGGAAEPWSQPSLPRRRAVAAALASTAADDVAAAHWRRPPPRPSLAETVLFHDGLHALCAQRVAAAARGAGDKWTALALQGEREREREG